MTRKSRQTLSAAKSNRNSQLYSFALETATGQQLFSELFGDNQKSMCRCRKIEFISLELIQVLFFF